MSLVLDLDETTQQLLRAAFGDNLTQAAREALAAEGYRSGKLSQYQVQQLLGFDNRWDTEAWLAKHNLIMYTLEDLEEDRRTIELALKRMET
jgi:hypothetical protein